MAIEAKKNSYFDILNPVILFQRRVSEVSERDKKYQVKRENNQNFFNRFQFPGNNAKLGEKIRHPGAEEGGE